MITLCLAGMLSFTSFTQAQTSKERQQGSRLASSALVFLHFIDVMLLYKFSQLILIDPYRHITDTNGYDQIDIRIDFYDIHNPNLQHQKNL